MDAVAEIGNNPVIRHNIQSEYIEMSRLTRDSGLPNPSRETKFSGTNGDREIFIFPVQLTTSRIGNPTRSVDPYSCYVWWPYIHSIDIDWYSLSIFVLICSYLFFSWVSLVFCRAGLVFVVIFVSMFELILFGYIYSLYWTEGESENYDSPWG